MTDTIETLDHIRDGIAALAARERRFGDMFAVTGMPPLRRLPGGFPGLLRIVTEQQLSLASAAAIWARMQARHDPLTPERMLALADEDFRAVGQSAAKIKTIRALSLAVVERRLDLASLDQAPDDEIRRSLTAVPGIGPWSAEVYLLACLGRPDAWPSGDLALQVAAQAAFGLPERPDARAMARLAESWRPWRAVAARLIWAYYATLKRPLAARAGAPA
ncbi:DNA-3-methyladenine glycosylase family protein [Rhodoligotrophos defluvii]|uniref:DNA-3-methyladenine glycosylase family protein n=1 Tax=Rhodoligotrophos defluvii TaxID=2561934 RepID=UPI0010C977C6|nr:DNA-3-methyladenine glycosylase [Rhodoligotrophos defluvii]